ncbi:MAG TPA: rhomboid family intramembrane serine protease [Vicinamibacteria bacterium]
MLLIPIGQADNVVRRHPIVSYALLALNVFVFLAVPSGPGPERVQEAQRWEEMVRYLVERPYLELPPVLAERCLAECRAELQTARDEHQRQHGPPEESQRAEEQAQLQEKAAEVERLLALRPTYRLGYVPAHPELTHLLSSMFVHAGWLHLLGNMLFLFLSAPFVEDLFGRPLFAALYLLSGAAAGLAHGWHRPESVTPLVGASGAIAGVMGAFLVRLATARIRFLLLPVPILWTFRFTFHLPAFVVLPAWLGEQFWYAGTEGSGVAWWAHIGGFAFGAGVAAVVRLTGVEQRFIHPSIEKEIGLEQNPGILAAVEARSAGDFARAAAEVDQVLREEPANVDAWRESYEVGMRGRDPERTGRAALRLLELYERMGEPDLAHELVWDALRQSRATLPARFLLAAGRHFERRQEWPEALEVYRDLVQASPDDPAAFRALFRSGEILRKLGQVQEARRALERARAHPACSEPLAVERALSELDGRAAAPSSARR